MSKRRQFGDKAVSIASPNPDHGQNRGQRHVRNGNPTNDLVFSAYAGGNECVFPHILSLYVAPQSVIADVTYGRGVFWRNVPEDRYAVLPRISSKALIVAISPMKTVG